MDKCFIDFGKRIRDLKYGGYIMNPIVDLHMHIVPGIDDGSKDSTSEIVESYKDDRIKLIKKENGGVSSARNLGIKKSKGDYVAFCDSDDVWSLDKLEKQVAVINS